MDGFCTHITYTYTIHMQPLQDRYLALGALVLVLVDVIILLVYITVEGVRGNLTAIRVPNREYLINVEGVGWNIQAIYHSPLYLCTFFSLYSSFALSNPSSVPTPPRNVRLSLFTSHISVAPQQGAFFWESCMATRCYCRSLPLFLPLQLARWRSRALMIPSISQQPSMWPALCWQSLSLLPTP